MENPELPGRGLSLFGQAALNSGLVPTMKSIIAMENQGDYFVLSVYHAIETLARLYKTATVKQKHTLSKQIVENAVLTVVYEVRIVDCFLPSSDQKLAL